MKRTTRRAGWTHIDTLFDAGTLAGLTERQ